MSDDSNQTILVTGATGFIGQRLATRLVDDGYTVRASVRVPERASGILRGSEIFRLDLGESQSDLERALDGVDVAYFLIHMMGRRDDYASREASGAAQFAQNAKAAGVKRVVYLGGLGDPNVSSHLGSRHETARVLEREGPPLTYFRAAMVIGAESESYVLLRSIVDRLVALPDNAWLEHRSQPIGVRDVIAYLRQAPRIPETEGREVQLGGPRVLTHAETVDELARQLGKRRRPRVPAPGVTPGVIASAATAVTRGDPKVARELVWGLATDSVVEDPSGMKLFDHRSEDLGVAFQRAIEDEERAGAR